MLKNHNIAEIADQVGVNPIEFEINFDPKNKDHIKVTLAGKKSFINKDDLWNFVFSIVTADKQRAMIPVIKTEMIKYTKQHTVILQKDLKKGDTMAVNCEVNVRADVVDAIQRDLEEKQELSTVSPYLQKGLEL